MTINLNKESVSTFDVRLVHTTATANVHFLYLETEMHTLTQILMCMEQHNIGTFVVPVHHWK